MPPIPWFTRWGELPAAVVPAGLNMFIGMQLSITGMWIAGELWRNIK